MRVLFCDDSIQRDTVAYQQAWERHEVPAQALYGALQLPENGIELQIMDYRKKKRFSSRVVAALCTTHQIYRATRKCDAVFSNSIRGLEGLMILRRLHLFSKPIFVWQHTAFQPNDKTISNKVKTWILKGIDEMFFFNQQIADEAIKTGKVGKYKVIPYGADMQFYSKSKKGCVGSHVTFLSTGIENRDYETLLNAFKNQSSELDIYAFPSNNGIDYMKILNQAHESNIHIHILKEPLPSVQLREITTSSDCIVISTLPLPYIYPCGLTSIVEAMALGKPIIATYNPWYGIDIEKEGIGFIAKSSEDWEKIIGEISRNPQQLAQMGEKAYQLAVKKYNIQNTGRMVAHEILSTLENTK